MQTEAEWKADNRSKEQEYSQIRRVLLTRLLGYASVFQAEALAKMRCDLSSKGNIAIFLKSHAAIVASIPSWWCAAESLDDTEQSHFTLGSVTHVGRTD